MGVGGAGGNAVNNMIRSKLIGCEFIAANTDAQAIKESLADTKIQLGLEITQGLGAGSKPDTGRAAAEESIEEVTKLIKDSNMLFITAGMGGGTGTGAAPVIARAAREMGILTVGVVTKPFQFEGAHRQNMAEKGIEELQKHVDTLIIIPNQNLFRIANEKTTFADAFKAADDVLYSGVRSVTDLMIIPGLINLDYADISTVTKDGGKAMMGTGEAEGDNRAMQAAEEAISNPLLEDSSMRGAKGVLISVTGGMDMTLFEVDEAVNRIREEIESEANIIFGSTFDERLNGKLRVSVVATGIDQEDQGLGPRLVYSEDELEEQTDDTSEAQTEASEQDMFDDDTSQPEETLLDDREQRARAMEEIEDALQSFKQDPEAAQPASPAGDHAFEDPFGEDSPYGREDPFEQQEEEKPSLFQRMKSSFMGSKKTRQPEEPQVRQVRIQSNQAASLDDDDDLDVSEVPAYIRRQKEGM
ncbi:MAG: cell division protein FtsZ [Alphaproteobacteria bacterium]